MKALVTGVAAVAATIIGPLAQADPGGGQESLSQPFSQAGAPFVGQWSAHKDGVVVHPDGTGSETSSVGTMTFKLDAVQTNKNPWDTAYGSVVSSSKAETGSYVTMQLVDGGNGLLFSWANGDEGFPFCKVANGSYLNSADCGA